MDFSMVLQVLQNIFSPAALYLLTLGMVVGVIFGIIPGLNGQIAVALLVPFTYGMTPENGLLMLGSIYMGASYGGSVTAILINIPGSGENACTVLDGNPLARMGRANEALTYSIVASCFGGVIGVIIMIFFTPVLARFALRFGPAEMFIVAIAGLVIVGSILGKSPAKGFIAMGIGLLIACVGQDSSSTSGLVRLTLGHPYLRGGLPQIPVMVGLFAVTEMLTVTMKQGKLAEGIQQRFTFIQGLKGLIRHWGVVLQSSIIGIIIGVLPGTGGAIAAFMAYGAASRNKKSKDPTKFGEGNVAGVIAPELANNVVVGGSFVPLLALGIPGSATSAIIFGALLIHGLQPGGQLFVEHAALVNTFMFGMLVTIPLMLVMGLWGSKKIFSYILKVDVSYIIPVVLVLSVIGSYSARNSMADVIITLVTGFIGVFFKRAKIPIAPIIIGIILGPIVETNFRRCIPIAMAADRNLFAYILFRPISIVTIVLLVLVLVTNFKGNLTQNNILKKA